MLCAGHYIFIPAVNCSPLFTCPAVYLAASVLSVSASSLRLIDFEEVP